MYFDNSCLVETKMGHHDRMKAADTYHSIHPYIFIASIMQKSSIRKENWDGYNFTLFSLYFVYL